MRRRYRTAAAPAVTIPEECPENARAVQLLAKEVGAGHYDSVNLLVLATLLIFVSVAFFAVNNGKFDDSKKVPLTKENFLSGKYTRGLEASYIDQLPIPDLIKKAEERLSLIYGFGNKITDPMEDMEIAQEDKPYNPFTPDDDDERNEGVFTTKPAETDENGNVSEKDEDETYYGGGTIAADRPLDPYSNEEEIIDDDDEPVMTTTNNVAPVVTVTTTVPAPNKPSTTTPSSSSSSSETDTSTSSEVSSIDTSEPDTETMPTDTTESVTMPTDTSEPDTITMEPSVTDTDPPPTDTDPPPTDTEPPETIPPDTAPPPEIFEE